MILFGKLRHIFYRYFNALNGRTLLLLLALYAVSSWLVLDYLGEQSLTHWPDFIYWLMVTASTVGYGDLSPTTDAGKWWVSLYVIPFGLTLFAMVIGRVAAWVSHQWFKGVKGLKQLHLAEHILVIGWNENRTINLLNLLLQENSDLDNPLPIVLCVRKEMENPMPGRIEFVHVSSFNQHQEMQKACINSASVVIIDNPEDDLTMTTALYSHQQNPEAHIIAYFQDDSLATLLKQHCPNVECTPSVAVEMLAKSAFDPGSSALHHELLNVGYGQAQYSFQYPLERVEISVSDLFMSLKKQYKATLIGIAEKQGASIQVNPDLENTIKPGTIVYYVADQRIGNIDWQQITTEAK